MRVELYDTTLRDGLQGEGFVLSLHDKLLVAQKLDELGVDLVEGGFPLSNPKDEAFFKEVKTLGLKHAQVSAFGMTRRRGVRASDDVGLKALLDADTPVVTLVGKTSKYQAEVVLNVSADENLDMIGESVAHLRSAGRRVVYDAEHFFDTFRADRAYALATLARAQDAGADVLCLCDTNGGSLPAVVAEATAAVVRQCGATAVGIHTHNDASLAVANALAAVEAGARHAQGTVNGVGERCGNMDLLVLAANLKLKLGRDVLRGDGLAKLTDASRFVYELANMPLHDGQPYVGRSAFAHKGGMHVHAVQKDASTYEHVAPESVGNARRVLVSEVSGASNIAAKATAGLDRDAQRRVLGRVQQLESEGYVFEAADGSFDLLLRGELGTRKAYFELDHWRCVILRSGEAGGAIAEATVKLRVGTVVEHSVAEGHGPVDALDAALRKALRPHLPSIDRLKLTDYKVRVVNGSAATAARVRVVLEFGRDEGTGHSRYFGTVGVDENVINASWEALIDGYEYHLLHAEEGK